MSPWQTRLCFAQAITPNSNPNTKRNKPNMPEAELPPCPSCKSDYVYADQRFLICPECGYEWDPAEAADDDIPKVKDANGTLLAEGDKVTLAKDLKVKGSSQVLKVGTKAIIRHIKEGKDHQLDCRVNGAGEMLVTAQFVKKA